MAKRGEGKLYLRGEMIWASASIRGKLYRKPTGKRYSSLTKKWFETTKGIDVIKEMLAEEQSILSQKDITLEKFGMSIINMTSENRGAASQKDAVSILKKWILPQFKNYALCDIKPLDIVHFLKYLKKNMSGERARKIKNLLSLILSYAYDNDIIEKNPMETKTVKLETFNTKPNDNRVYTTDEVRMILENAHGWLRVFLEISFTSGLRVGEVMALQWDDFDLDHGFFYVSRSMSKGVLTIGNSGDKNHNRPIPILPRTLQVLKSYFDVRPSNEWLFINKDSRPFLESKTIIDYHFKPFLKTIDVEYKTLQATRRTYASIMNFGGSNRKETKQIMGHSDNSNTMDKHYIKQGVLNNLNLANIAKSSEDVFNSMVGLN